MPKNKNSKKLAKSSSFSNRGLMLFVAVFAVVGGIWAFVSFAATPPDGTSASGWSTHSGVAGITYVRSCTDATHCVNKLAPLNLYVYTQPSTVPPSSPMLIQSLTSNKNGLFKQDLTASNVEVPYLL